ncbi:MAG: hypothetical protein KME52_20445 [Desmonostoc geniculatum HA4340-LM1]|uniref:Uncharacterized protein n=1 Tax=Desmonostoc muscorum LEGE 12446 TaxID=1828758 RepID=A0A8J7DK12_DESMC|nr:hypothetical protein [Desmonostoc muscorum]MBW4676294.1 hypothetical protein [Desmonostoc geniculatum HA4340-LM1]MCF2147636.1 hypothetical protein [Desmonostoc muscorum LEGE 12446]
MKRQDRNIASVIQSARDVTADIASAIAFSKILDISKSLLLRQRKNDW